MSEAVSLAGDRPLRTPLRVVRVTSDGRKSAPLEPMEPLSLLFSLAGEPRRVALGAEPISAGAHIDNDVIVEDPLASGFHIKLFRRTDGRVWLRDVGSTNGTWVDGMRVTECEVLPGSTIRVGRTSLRVERDDDRLPLPKTPGLVAQDPVLRPVLDLLHRGADSLLPILILGESGSGKEVAARATHELSPRAAGPFVPLNCGAIAPELAEAELFGHERGAFTGAVASSPGAFRVAHGGTLFLDEIGDLTLSLQVKLLRALESSEVKPVGAARAERVDVRVVCATHRNLKQMVADGLFREDLYFRLAGLTVELPPLRDRQLDILPLAERFLAEIGDGVERHLLPDARAALVSNRWPGNVRELRHVVRLAALLNQGPAIRRSSLRFESPAVREIAPLRDHGHAGVIRFSEPPHEPYGRGRPPSATPSSEDFVDLRGKTLEELEGLAVRASFRRNKGNRKAMMRELGLSKSSLLRRLDALGLRGPEVPEDDG